MGLVDGGYGFLVPVGWKKYPLASVGGPASVASFTDPDSGARITFTENGGSSGVIYDAKNRPATKDLDQLVQCDHVLSHVVLGPATVAYACAGHAPGMEANGVITIRPYPDGYDDLLVVLPKTMHATATKILNSLARG